MRSILGLAQSNGKNVPVRLFLPIEIQPMSRRTNHLKQSAIKASFAMTKEKVLERDELVIGNFPSGSCHNRTHSLL
jgi:hypothetical protein